MEINHKVSSAAMYTDFNELTRLRAEVNTNNGTDRADDTNARVASQIEAMFFQMVLKSMREAHSLDSSDSDQTRFYQDMFDKQITLELAENNRGNGSGLAAMIEQQISGHSVYPQSDTSTADAVTLIRNQVSHPASGLQQQEIDQE